MFRRRRLRVVGALLLSAGLQAQTFGVASVKPSAPDNSNGSTFEYLTGGGLRVRNGTLHGLIESAYDVRDFQVIGGPNWVTTERFDVSARSQSSESPAPRSDEMRTARLKLRLLLADRFKLVVHHETRELPQYVLRVDKGGPKLASGGDVPPANGRTGIQSDCGHLIGTFASVANLAVYLSRQLRRPVVDATTLAARYNFELSWTPELSPCADSTESAPSIFTALQEQLGLKLESIKGPSEVVVIDAAEMPPDN
jgi:uncharacterized protein (TIGR03435 family)